jgi:hypothetical protein
MHHCLEIPEILLQIFESTTSGSHDMSTLASLARSCRSFFEIAVDLMWAWRDLYHLVMLMPEDLWEPTSTDVEVQSFFCSLRTCSMLILAQYCAPPMILHFNRPLQPSDWCSFVRYSHRIRSVSMMCIPYDVLQALSNNAPVGNTLFPNVRLLWCSCGDVQSSKSISSLFLGPDLRDLNVDTQNFTQEGLELLLTSISQRSDHISTVHISARSSESANKFSDVICNFVCNYSSLRSISLDGVSITDRLVEHVASLPYLHLLRWSPDTFVPKRDFVPSLTSIESFHYIGKQDPSTDSLAGFISFAETLNPRTKVPDLTLKVPCRTTPAQIKRTLELLSEKWCHKTLDSIHFGSPDSIRRNPLLCAANHEIPLKFTALAPMLSFHHLKRITMTGSLHDHLVKCTFDMDDDDLLAMSEAWPSLQRFKIKTTGFKITLNGFLGLVRRCPRLTVIELDEMDFSTRSYVRPDGESEVGCFPRLIMLQVGHSNVDDGQKLLEVFLPLFPGLLSRCFLFRNLDNREWHVVRNGLPKHRPMASISTLG